MILSDISLRRLNQEIDLITPFHERTVVHGMTYGLGPAGYDVRVAEYIDIPPGTFKLASTIERFQMPNDLLGTVRDKSTLARLGLAVQNTVIEPGWEGFLTLEISNHSRHTVIIEAGMPIAQIIFEQIDLPVSSPYNGKYQNQPSGAQKAIMEYEQETTRSK